MKIKKGDTVILTGASGGIGVYIARELATLDVNMVLVAYPGEELVPLEKELQRLNIDAVSVVADLSASEERQRVFDLAVSRFGGVDALINNAGIEFTVPYHELTEDQIDSVIAVNLSAAMQLSRLVLPGMLERGRGHIVNMSSLAGKAAPALQEPYAASKAGLIGFTMSLRETYRNTGVSASVICPGFVEAGMYARLKQTSGNSAPPLLGTVSPEKVCRAVTNAIERDTPQVLVNALPVKPLLAVSELSPSLGAWIVRKIGAHSFFRKAYQAQK